MQERACDRPLLYTPILLYQPSTVKWETAKSCPCTHPNPVTRAKSSETVNTSDNEMQCNPTYVATAFFVQSPVSTCRSPHPVGIFRIPLFLNYHAGDLSSSHLLILVLVIPNSRGDNSSQSVSKPNSIQRRSNFLIHRGGGVMPTDRDSDTSHGSTGFTRARFLS